MCRSLAIGYSAVVNVEQITMWKFHASTVWLGSNQYPLGVTLVLHEMARKASISGHIVHRLAYGSLVWDIYDARDKTSDACPPHDKVWWRQNAFTSGNGGFESSRAVSSPMHHPQLSTYTTITSEMMLVI